jgi:hypothetical protein
MKKTIFAALFLLASFIGNAQSNVTTDKNGNFIAVQTADTATATPTGKTYTAANGELFPVMQSTKGKLFVIRTSKTGTKYKFYLKP